MTSPDLFFVLFADDTNVLISGKNLEQLQEKLNNELKNIETWLIANKLSLNVGKTKYIIFTSKRRIYNARHIKLYINDTQLERVQSTKFLGLVIDSHLTWKEHIQCIKLKISRTIGILYKIKHILNRSTFMTIYHSLIFSYLNYANTIWGGSNMTTINCLFLCQKRFARIATNSDYRAHSYPLFKDLKMLTVFDMFKVNQCEFLYNIDSYKSVFPDLFSKHTDIHNYNTRNKSKYIKPLTKTSYGQKRISFTATTEWNQVPFDIKQSKSAKELKNRLKKYYILRYN